MERESRGENGRDRSQESAPSRTERAVGSRGQTNVLGIVLLVGFVAVGGISVVLVGSTVLETQRTTIEDEHARQSMLEFTHAAETSTIDGGEPSGVAFGTLDDGRVELRDDGHVRVVNASGSNDVLYEESLGALVYDTERGDVAYQGGRLWHRDGERTVPISSASTEFRDGQFRFPIVRLTGDEFRSESLDGTIRRTGPPTTVESRGGDSRVSTHAGQTLRVEIASEYCDGWEREIEETAPGEIVERCSDAHANRLRFELEVPPGIGDVDGAVIAEEIDVHRSAPDLEGDVRAESVDEDKVNGTVYDDGYDRPSVDGLIDDAIAECDEFDELDSEVSGPGPHCTDEITGTHVFDTSNGDVTVVVRDSIGDPNYQDDLRVEGENEVTILVDGDVHARGNARIGNRTDPSRLRLFVSSDGEVTTATGGPEIAALLYASDSDVSFRGNPTLEGSVVADRVEIGNVNPGVISYHESIGDAAFRPGVGSPLRSVHVTAYELEIDG